MIRAMFHAWRTGHRLWREDMIWPGERAMVYFCDCGEQFWPLEKEGPCPDWRDNPVRRERPAGGGTVDRGVRWASARGQRRTPRSGRT